MRLRIVSAALQFTSISPFFVSGLLVSSSSRLLLASTATTSTLLRMSSTEATNTAATDEYVPPKVWSPSDMGGKFGGVNRPTAGAREQKKLPRGKHPLQLYSMGTPNGQKVTILLEELLAMGYSGAEYDAYYIDIMNEDQFGSDFVDINPNSKIPALVDTTTNTNMFESGSILLQLSEKFDNALCPANKRSDVLNWLFWQMGSAPYVGAGFGHFWSYAPTKMKYPIDRFSMEAKRQLDVLEKQLAKTQKWIVGDEYTLADIAIFPWYGKLALGQLYTDSATFLNIEQDYPNVIRWAKDMEARPAVQRGSIVNKTWGEDGEKLKERHDASDFDNLKEPTKEDTSKL